MHPVRLKHLHQIHKKLGGLRICTYFVNINEKNIIVIFKAMQFYCVDWMS